jgi:nanoRNase/pAp phosphatase (c-di-AMP/oligoRNAs hydrolase)
MDSRTGLGRFRDFRISNYDLMMDLIEACIRHASVEDILGLPDVAERVVLYREQHDLFVDQLKRVSSVQGDVVVVDLRGEDVIHAGNRFMVYALFPEARVSVHLIPGKENRNTVLAVGRSIIDRSSSADIGAVMLRHGGGHRAAGTCQVPHGRAEEVLRDVIRSVGSSPVAV